MPPYLAGRQKEKEDFSRLLGQDIVLENMVLTGLRGVGKTVLADTLKPIAIQQGWLWVGTDLSESTSISEERVATRLMTDLAPLTSALELTQDIPAIGFSQASKKNTRRLDFETMASIYTATPGLVSDKIKAVLEFVWQCLSQQQVKGIIFAYDEAQNLSDHAAANEYPLSLMLDVFQSIQKKVQNPVNAGTCWLAHPVSETRGGSDLRGEDVSRHLPKAIRRKGQSRCRGKANPRHEMPG